MPATYISSPNPHQQPRLTVSPPPQRPMSDTESASRAQDAESSAPMGAPRRSTRFSKEDRGDAKRVPNYAESDNESEEETPVRKKRKTKHRARIARETTKPEAADTVETTSSAPEPQPLSAHDKYMLVRERKICFKFPFFQHDIISAADLA